MQTDPRQPTRRRRRITLLWLSGFLALLLSLLAGVIGTPSLRFNTWAGRHPYQVELEERWGLTKAFLLSDEDAFFAELDRLIDDLPAAYERQAEGRARMLEWCRDPVDDLTEWTYELAGRPVPDAD